MTGAKGNRGIAFLAGGLLALAGCDREAPPAYVPPPAYAPPAPPPSYPPAYQPLPPPVPSGEQLTVARACASDIERFCASVPPRQGFVKACMKAHVTELSAGCFDTVMGAIAAEQPP